jgi:DNA-directed RNA polymerase specialized sigma24 family protein
MGAADSDLADAAAGSQSAWDRLVDRHAQRVWSTARGSGLDATVAADVCQLMWTRLVNHLDELSTDEQVREWLCAATEDEVCRVLRAGPSAINRTFQRSADTDRRFYR